MAYTIECRRQRTDGRWLSLSGWLRRKADAMCIAQDMAIELNRTVRIVVYAPVFRVIAEFNSRGQPFDDHH